MKYYSGIDVKVGDKVTLNDDEAGVVVAILDDREFLSAIYEDKWQNLDVGVIIVSSKYGVFHYPEINEEVVFHSRADD
jgi:hypothetical protein